MYKRLSIFALALAIALAHLYSGPELSNLVSISFNRTKSSNNIANIESNMAVASVSRSIVKKVLAVETPEVSLQPLVSLYPNSNCHSI